MEVAGRWRYLADVFFSERRDAGAARLFFSRAIARTQVEPAGSKFMDAIWDGYTYRG